MGPSSEFQPSKSAPERDVLVKTLDKLARQETTFCLDKGKELSVKKILEQGKQEAYFEAVISYPLNGVRYSSKFFISSDGHVRTREDSLGDRAISYTFSGTLDFTRTALDKNDQKNVAVRYEELESALRTFNRATSSKRSVESSCQTDPTSPSFPDLKIRGLGSLTPISIKKL